MQLVSKVIFIILAAVRLSPQVPTSPTVGPAAAVSWQYTAGDDQAGGGPERGRPADASPRPVATETPGSPEPAEVHDVENDVRRMTLVSYPRVVRTSSGGCRDGRRDDHNSQHRLRSLRDARRRLQLPRQMAERTGVTVATR